MCPEPTCCPAGFSTASPSRSKGPWTGAALGYFVGKAVTRYNPVLEKHNMALAPKAEDSGYSLSLVHRF